MKICLMRSLAALLLLLAAALPAVAQTLTPQGRLTLASNTPVPTLDVVGATTVYYDCYAGNTVPVGAALTNLTIGSCQVSMGLDATANIVAAHAYDVFGVSSGGVLAICAGPAWATTTSRGSGAGTTQIDQTNGGLWTNTNSLTHCWSGAAGVTDLGPVAAHAGTYLGSFYATANGQTTMQLAPTAAAGGTNNVMGLYNAYQRVMLRSISQDSTSSWTYAVATWRMADNSASNRITWFDGLGQSQVSAGYVITASVNAEVGVNFDVTSGIPSGLVSDQVGAAGQSAGGNAFVGLGLHYAQAMETERGGSVTYYGAFTGVSGIWNVLSIEWAD